MPVALIDNDGNVARPATAATAAPDTAPLEEAGVFVSVTVPVNVVTRVLPSINSTCTGAPAGFPATLVMTALVRAACGVLPGTNRN